ncbi:MAG: hypothetical protein CMH60_03520 [Myxococcales bacterium]|nr:hypothetical protein [Myxococcales bacterium]
MKIVRKFDIFARSVKYFSSFVRQLIVMSSLALYSGCLLPPDIEPAAIVFNQPPRILPDSLTPDPTDGPKVMSTQCEQYQFFARIADPDALDSLYYRVFLDYQADINPLDTNVETIEPDPENPQESYLISFVVYPTDLRFIGDGRIGETHTVELLLSDREFYSDEREPLARAIPEDGFTDSFIWPVVLSEESCPTGVSE